MGLLFITLCYIGLKFLSKRYPQNKLLQKINGFADGLLTGFASIKNLKKLDILLIDECSMMRADILDGIDESLRKNRGSKNCAGNY